MSRRTVDPASVTPRTQADSRGISRGDVVELPGGALAVAVARSKRGLVVEPISGADAKSLDNAVRRFQSFTGATPKGVVRLKRPPQNAVLLKVGELIGVAYETERDGKRELRYFHRFKKSARPHLAASPDGHRLEVLGGDFQFTDRGIVDA